MTFSPDAPDARATPVQQRGHERIDLLLDTAARIVKEQGMSRLTTSAVAAASGSSVGVVYRYFPHADALLLALAERNRNRYLEALDRHVAASGAPDWHTFVQDSIDSYVELILDEPAFAEVRFGDVVAVRFGGEPDDVNAVVRARLADALVTRYGFTPGEDLLFYVELAIECVDAVARRGIFRDRRNEARFFHAAFNIAVGILLPASPGGSRLQIPGTTPV